MNKSLNQLENERKEKIKELNLDEVKSYITNLNKKLYESFDNNNHEDVELYQSKLKEVFELTSDKYVNLDAYSLLRKFEITSSKMIEENTKSSIIQKVHLTLASSRSCITLHELYYHLEYILMIYYNNYYTNENMLVDDLLAHLHFEYNFNDEGFDEYARSRVNMYNETLMRELDSLINHLKAQITRIIEVCDGYVNTSFEEEISSIVKEVEYEKQYLKNNNREEMKFLKEGNYVALLDSLKQSCMIYGESCRCYIDLKEKILDLINSHDGFLSLKEHSYEFDCKYGVSSSKEEYIASRPSYDVSKCEFIESD